MAPPTTTVKTCAVHAHLVSQKSIYSRQYCTEIADASTVYKHCKNLTPTPLGICLHQTARQTVSLPQSMDISGTPELDQSDSMP